MSQKQPTRNEAEKLAALAVSSGVLAFVEDHPKFGWSVWARVKGHADRERLVDRHDVRWVAAEIESDRAELEKLMGAPGFKVFDPEVEELVKLQEDEEFERLIASLS